MTYHTTQRVAAMRKRFHKTFLICVQPQQVQHFQWVIRFTLSRQVGRGREKTCHFDDDMRFPSEEEAYVRAFAAAYHLIESGEAELAFSSVM